MTAAILIIGVFVFFAFLMITKRMSALLAMPFMAVSCALVAGIFSGRPLYDKEGGDLFSFLFVDVMTKGSFRLAEAMMYAVFGSLLSQVVQKTGIAERIVKTAAELAGDRKILIAVLLSVASAAVFTSVTGLGGFIMVASLVLPVMMAAGLSPLYSSCLLLLSLAVGGIFNFANWGFYKSALGVEVDVIREFSVAYAILLALVAALFLIVEMLRERGRILWAVKTDEKKRKLPAAALLTPILPILLILNPWYSFPVIPAFIAAALYGAVTAEFSKTVAVLTASAVEGLRDVAPVLGLFIGIGMLLNAVMAPETAAIMKPFLAGIVPSGKISYLLCFVFLAPLALYRGPFNLYGLGSGLAAILIGSNLMAPVAVMAAFLAVGQIQSVCDPTNTHNVWLSQYMKVSTDDILKKTLPYVWGFVLLALLYAVFFKGVL